MDGSIFVTLALLLGMTVIHIWLMIKNLNKSFSENNEQHYTAKASEALCIAQALSDLDIKNEVQLVKLKQQASQLF